MDRGAWQATYSPWSFKESDMTEHTHTHTWHPVTIRGRTVGVMNSEVIGFGLRNTETNFRFTVITSSQFKHFQTLRVFFLYFHVLIQLFLDCERTQGWSRDQVWESTQVSSQKRTARYNNPTSRWNVKTQGQKSNSAVDWKLRENLGFKTDSWRSAWMVVLAWGRYPR